MLSGKVRAMSCQVMTPKLHLSSESFSVKLVRINVQWNDAIACSLNWSQGIVEMDSQYQPYH